MKLKSGVLIGMFLFSALLPSSASYATEPSHPNIFQPFGNLPAVTEDVTELTNKFIHDYLAANQK